MHVLVARLRLNLFNDDGDGSVHIFFFIPYVILQVYLNFIPSRDSFQKIVSTLLLVRLAIRFSNSYVCFFCSVSRWIPPCELFCQSLWCVQWLLQHTNGLLSVWYNIFFYLCTKTLWKQTVKLQSVTFSIDYAKYLISIQ